jgi:hypothetical protein
LTGNSVEDKRSIESVVVNDKEAPSGPTGSQPDRRNFIRKLVSIAALGGIAASFLGEVTLPKANAQCPNWPGACYVYLGGPFVGAPNDSGTYQTQINSSSSFCTIELINTGAGNGISAVANGGDGVSGGSNSGNGLRGSGVTGVYGTSSSGVGYGVEGKHTGGGTGVYGETNGTDAGAVTGHATSTTGGNAGVSGFSDSTDGCGIYGIAIAPTYHFEKSLQFRIRLSGKSGYAQTRFDEYVRACDRLASRSPSDSYPVTVHDWEEE